MPAIRFFEWLFGALGRRRDAWIASGSSAEAEVLETLPTTWTEGAGVPVKRAWKLRLRVRPASGPEFEVATRQSFRMLNSPIVGQTLHVIYDPADHRKLIVDHRSAADREAGSGSPRAEPEVSLAALAGGAGAGGLPRGIQVLTLGPHGVVLQSGAGAAAPADPLEELGRLADLRDRGILDDQEFEVQKRRLLGEQRAS